MQKQPTQGGTPTLAEQPAPQEIHKKNAWWRQPRINRSVRRLPYVISEGDVWFGRKGRMGIPVKFECAAAPYRRAASRTAC